MKKVLSLLVAFIFLQVQTWALSGGPIYPSTAANTDLTGSYSGTMVSKRVSTGTGIPAPTTNSSTGVFSIVVPISGAAVGTTVIFQGGVTFTGTISAAANNSKRSITGVITATSATLWTVAAAVPAFIFAGPPVVVVPAVPAVTTNLFAQGTLSAKVSRRTGGVGGVDTTGAAVSLGDAGDLLSGSATMTALFLNSAVVGGPAVANTVKYSVSGVRQTNVVATTGTTP